MAMRAPIWLGLGLLAGLLLASAIGLIVVELLLPWEDICAVVGPAREVVETGSALLASLETWLAQVESFLTTSPSEEAATEARTGLGGLVSKATEVVGGAASFAADVATAPVQALVDLAQLVVAAVQAVVDTAQDVLTSVDQSRC